MAVDCSSLKDVLLCLIDDGTHVLLNDNPELLLYGFSTYKENYYLSLIKVKERRLSGNTEIDGLFHTEAGRYKMAFLLNAGFIFRSDNGVGIIFPSEDEIQRLESMIDIIMT